MAAALLALGMLAPGSAWADDPSLSFDETDARAIALGREIEATLPYSCTGSCGGRLRVSLRTIGGGLRASATVALATGTGEQKAQLVLRPGGSRSVQQELVLHYAFTSGSWRKDGAIALARILRGPKILVLGQKQLVAGTRASLRLLVVDMDGGAPMAGARVTARVALPGGRPLVRRGQTNAGGTLESTWPVPLRAAGRKGRIALRAETAIGVAEVLLEPPIEARVRTLLTSDKPLYQPGQTMHLRTLSLRSPSGGALADLAVALEVKDSRGNVVFRAARRTDRFGIAHARFALAERVNLGRYRIAAQVTSKGYRHRAVRTVRVARYRLPRFHVTVIPARSYYRPGDPLTGRVAARYVWGKPVVGAKVELEAARRDLGYTTFARITGRTDASGHLAFRALLPRYFVGRALAAGRAELRLRATVIEAGGEKRQATRTVPVAKHDVQIAVIPESGSLVGGLEQKVHLLTALADGTPVAAQVRISDLGTQPTAPRVVRTDARGIGSFTLTPTVSTMHLFLQARDGRGRVGRERLRLHIDNGKQVVLVRPSKALLRAGEAFSVDVLSSRQAGWAYVDLVHAGQTISTHSVQLVAGRGRLPITLGPEVGVVLLSAYVANAQGEVVRDVRPLYVRAPGDLRVKITAGKPEYRPGSPAEIDFRVTDAKGRPVVAALGVQIVDSALFHLLEMRPGLARTFFRLEQDLLRPRVSVLGFRTPLLIRPGLRPPGVGPSRPTGAPVAAAAAAASSAEAARQRAGEVLLSAAAPGYRYPLRLDSRAAELARVAKRAVALAQPVLRRIAYRVAGAVRRYIRKNYCWASPDGEDLVDEKLLRKATLRDPWRNLVTVEVEPSMTTFRITVTSKGMDEELETEDDVKVTITGRRAKRCHRPRPRKHVSYRSLGGGWGNGGSANGGSKNGGHDPGAKHSPRPRPRVSPTDPSATQPSPTTVMPGRPIRVRKDFPESLYVNPALITDAQGRAKVALRLADSITRWRISALASTADGRLGSALGGVRVFTPFFADVTLPVAVTRGDRITVPVALHNYSGRAERIRVTLKPAAWYRVLGGPATQTVTVAARGVGAARFYLEVRQVGVGRLRVEARGAAVADAVERTLTVRPDGDAVPLSVAGSLETPQTHAFAIPAGIVPRSATLQFTLAPGPLAAVVDGLDSMLQMPHGCFEQTSSTTYPNVMILRYLQATRRASPALAARARRLVAVGYQRLISFEVGGGGFSLYGRAPADRALTAYGLHEFLDMAAVHPVDAGMLARTRRFLRGAQRGDGSWRPGESYFFDDSEGSIPDRVRITAYIVWALIRAGDRGKAVQRALTYLRRHVAAIRDAYTLALVASAFAARYRGHALVRRLLARIVALRQRQGKRAHWPLGQGQTITGSGKRDGGIETTALVAALLLRQRRQLAVARAALAHLVRAKSPSGAWGSTQGTVLVLQALLAAARARTLGDARGKVTVVVDGQPAGTVNLTAVNKDVVHIVDLSARLRAGTTHQVGVRFAGRGVPMYQLRGAFYLPYGKIVRRPPRRPKLDLKVSYSKQRLTTDDTITVQVTLDNPTKLTAVMPMIDLGVPAGFDVITADLAQLVTAGEIARFDRRPRQLIIYLGRLRAGGALRFSYRLRVRWPLRVAVPPSRAYEYYRNDVASHTPAARLVAQRPAARRGKP